MDQKKSLIVASSVVVIVLAGAVLYFAVNNKPAPAASPTQNSNEQADTSAIKSNVKNPADANTAENDAKASVDEFAILAKLIQTYPEAKFSKQQDASFEWRDDNGDVLGTLQGKSVTAINTTNLGLSDEGSFFEKAGFKQSVGNGADGTKGGQQGFSNGESVCLYEYTITGEDKNATTKDPLIYDLKISCAKNPAK